MPRAGRLGARAIAQGEPPKVRGGGAGRKVALGLPRLASAQRSLRADEEIQQIEAVRRQVEEQSRAALCGIDAPAGLANGQ